MYIVIVDALNKLEKWDMSGYVNVNGNTNVMDD